MSDLLRLSAMAETPLLEWTERDWQELESCQNELLFMRTQISVLAATERTSETEPLIARIVKMLDERKAWSPIEVFVNEVKRLAKETGIAIDVHDLYIDRITVQWQVAMGVSRMELDQCRTKDDAKKIARDVMDQVREKRR